MKSENITKSIIRKVLLEQATPPGPDWTKIAPSQVTVKASEGCEVKQGTDNKWYFKTNSCRANVTTTTTATPNPTNTSTTKAPDTISPPFQKCVAGIPGIYRNGDTAIFYSDGTQYVLNIDGTYYSSQGTKGTYSCVSDINLSLNETPNKPESSGSGIEFPSCVTGLKKADNYYYGTAMDDQNNQYTVMYYSDDKTSSNGTNGKRVGIIPKGGNTPMNGVYICAGDQIIITSWDGNVRLTAKGVESKTNDGGNAEQILEGINTYNVGNLDIFYGDYNVNTVTVRNAVQRVSRYIQDKYRSTYFNYFFEMISKMKDYSTAYNRPNDVTFLENMLNDLTKVKTDTTNLVENKLASMGNLRWDPFSDPDELDESVYKQPINFKGRFPWDKSERDIMVYQLTDELMSRTEMEKTQQKMSNYMQNFQLTKENCKTELKTLLTYAGKTDLIRGIFDKRSETVNVGRSYNPTEIQAIKQRIVLCNGGDQPQNSMYLSGREKEAIDYLATPEAGKFRIDFGADEPSQQPK